MLRRILRTRYTSGKFHLPGSATVELLLDCGHVVKRKATRRPKRAYCRKCGDTVNYRSAARRIGCVLRLWIEAPKTSTVVGFGHVPTTGCGGDYE